MAVSGIVGGEIGYRLLKNFGRHATAPDYQSAVSYSGVSKLESLFGKDVWKEVQGRVCIDYGCGLGTEAIEMAEHGAARVIGIDTWDKAIRISRENARAANVEKVCQFVNGKTEPEEYAELPKADVIFSLDAFEHYDEPEKILQEMHRLLKPGGRVMVCFGPPWLHPYGAHLFSIFPWSHLVFTEAAQIRWRSDFKSDGATRFHEVDGGLNGMTISRFRRLVEENNFSFASFEAVPIRPVRWFHNALTQEFFTSVVRCTLVAD